MPHPPSDPLLVLSPFERTAWHTKPYALMHQNGAGLRITPLTRADKTQLWRVFPQKGGPLLGEVPKRSEDILADMDAWLGPTAYAKALLANQCWIKALALSIGAEALCLSDWIISIHYQDAVSTRALSRSGPDNEERTQLCPKGPHSPDVGICTENQILPYACHMIYVPRFSSAHAVLAMLHKPLLTAALDPVPPCP